MPKLEQKQFLEGVFTDPQTLRKKLVLAIALAPPKSRPSKPSDARRRQRKR